MDTIKLAAAIIAERAIAVHNDRLVKQAQPGSGIAAWLSNTAGRVGSAVSDAAKSVREQANPVLSRIRNPNVNLAQTYSSPANIDEAFKQHLGNVGYESLRNALIGAGVGGVGGALSSLFDERRRRRPLSKALRGALLGATLGGLGTAGYRGGEYLTSEYPDRGLEAAVRNRDRAKKLETDLRLAAQVDKATGVPAADIARRQAAIRAEAEARWRAEDAATKPGADKTVKPVEDSLIAGAQRRGGAALEAAKELAPAEAARAMWGTHDQLIPGVPTGAIIGGASPFVARQVGRELVDRWRFYPRLHNAELAVKATGLPTFPELIRSGPHRGQYLADVARRQAGSADSRAIQAAAEQLRSRYVVSRDIPRLPVSRNPLTWPILRGFSRYQVPGATPTQMRAIRPDASKSFGRSKALGMAVAAMFLSWLGAEAEQRGLAGIKRHATSSAEALGRGLAGIKRHATSSAEALGRAVNDANPVMY